jgi:hypothetical protein
MSAIDRLAGVLARGPRHRRLLEEIEIRIAVSGTRGKSTVVTWLHEALVARGFDTYAKVTGEVPHSLYNGERYPIERNRPTKLYETAREMRRFGPVDAIVIENQGIHEHTTRLVNAHYVDPTVVALTNVRRDHLDTLGSDTFEIARAFARSVPAGVPVVTAERDPRIVAYLERTLSRQDSRLRSVIPPGADPSPAEELVALVEATLDLEGVPSLRGWERRSYLDRVRVAWTDLPGGRIFDAASANDVDSTELLRREVAGDEVVQPLVYLRGDRPGRTASFLEYLDDLGDAGLIEQVRLVGEDTAIARRHLSVSVLVHDDETESPDAVLDAALADGWPVVLMGNAVPDWMRSLHAEIDARRRLTPDAAVDEYAAQVELSDQ